MSRRTAALLPSTEALVEQLGDRLRLARRRRRLSAKQVAERAGMTPMTLRSLERGGTGVTIGAYLAVMQVLGIEKDFDLLAQADTTGRALQDARISRRRRSRAERSTASSPSHVTSGPPTKPHNRLPENTPPAQLPRLFGLLPAAQMRQALEAVRPIRDAQNAIDLSVAKMESAPTEQLRKVFESLPVEQMRRALDALPQAQIQNALSGWIEQSGFASSKALAELIDTTMPSPNAKER